MNRVWSDVFEKYFNNARFDVCTKLCLIFFLPQAIALIELFKAPPGRYKHDVYLLPKKMGKQSVYQFSLQLSQSIKQTGRGK